ncbi:DUF434 domain-containing protein [Tautonia marina]|uniref:DUF434 domain-containing protein n=1 Tax=Tautonia marina TaxID=2653855 RepID=UPI001375C3A0|nr:DUF434 domain-containing protein [Tautonia marina]
MEKDCTNRSQMSKGIAAMPDRRSHRGADPRDASLFAPEAIPALREAVADLAWLFGRGYAEASSLKLVGDRHRLPDRSRKAVLRSACSDAQRADRLSRRLDLDAIAGRSLRIDGFNVLTTIEAALGGAPLLLGRDGSLRDLAGVHGTYRRVEETRPAIALIGEALADWRVGPSLWLLDRPVSNSGRLAAILREVASDRGWPWEVELPFNPDAELIAGPAEVVVASADSEVLDHCAQWFPMARLVVERAVPGAWVVDLSEPPRVGPGVAEEPSGQ